MRCSAQPMARKVRKVPEHASLIINAARRVFLSLREDLRQVEERFAGGSGTNNQCYTPCRSLAASLFFFFFFFFNAFTMKLRDIQQSEAS